MPIRAGENLAHGQHDVRVRLQLAIRRTGPVHVQVRHHAAPDELLAHEVPHQPDRLGSSQLARQCDLDVAGELCVAALLPGLYLVPQRGAVQPAWGGTVR